jgi:hypothetical protein
VLRPVVPLSQPPRPSTTVVRSASLSTPTTTPLPSPPL